MDDVPKSQLDTAPKGLNTLPQSEWDDLFDLPSDGYLDHLPLLPEPGDVSQAEGCLGTHVETFGELHAKQVHMAHEPPDASHRVPKRSTGTRDLRSQSCASGPVSLPSLDAFAMHLGQSPATVSRPTSAQRAQSASISSMPPSPSPNPVNHGHNILSHQASDSSMHSKDSAVSVSSKRGLRIIGGYPCDECTALFDVPSDLRHHQRKHISKDDRPYACAVCTDRFMYPKDLVRHMRRKHGIQDDSQQELGGGGRISTTVDNFNEPTVFDESAVQINIDSRRVGSTSRYDHDTFETNETLIMKLKAAREDAGLWLAERNYYAELVGSDSQHQAPTLYFKYDEMGRTAPVERARGWLLAIKALLKAEKNERVIHEPERTAQALDCLMKDLESLAIFESRQ